MKYAHIDNNEKLLGWYDSNIHKNIPTPNIEVTEEQWQIALNDGHNKVNSNGTTELFDFRTPEQIESEDKAKQIAEAKAYLASTDFKVLPDYDKDSTEVKVKRQEAREFIRANEGDN